MLYTKSGNLRAPKTARVILAGVITLAMVGYLIYEYLHDKTSARPKDGWQHLQAEAPALSSNDFMVIDSTIFSRTFTAQGGPTVYRTFYVCPIASAIKEGVYNASRRAWNADTLEVNLGLWNSRESRQPLTKAWLRIDAATITTSLKDPIRFRFAPGTDFSGRFYGDVSAGEFRPLSENPSLTFKFLADSLVKRMPDTDNMLCISLPVGVLNSTPPAFTTKYLPLSVKVHRRQGSAASNTARKKSETERASRYAGGYQTKP